MAQRWRCSGASIFPAFQRVYTGKRFSFALLSPTADSLTRWTLLDRRSGVNAVGLRAGVYPSMRWCPLCSLSPMKILRGTVFVSGRWAAARASWETGGAGGGDGVYHWSLRRARRHHRATPRRRRAEREFWHYYSCIFDFLHQPAGSANLHL